MNIKNKINDSLKNFGYEIRKIHNGFSGNNNLKWLTDYNFDTILDIGANEGQYARFIKNLFPNARLISFEPIKECYDILVSVSNPEMRNFTAFNYALGDENKTEKFHLNDFNPSSSLLDISNASIEHFPFTKNQRTINVEVKRLDDIVDELNPEGKMLVKIDVQGYEKNVLMGGCNFLKTGEKMIILEVSIKKLYNNEPDFHEIYNILYSMGYSYIGNLDQLYSPVNGEILQIDAVFYRKA